MSQIFFRGRKANPAKLLAYGFISNDTGYCYGTDMVEGQFRLTVRVCTDGHVQTEVMDQDSGEEYILHRIATATGAFAGMVKAAYETVLTDIAEKCFDPDVFKSSQAKELIAHVREKYGDELEFLWKKFPDNAVWRRKDTNKWYAALLTVSGRKLGLDSDERIEIIDLRMMPETITEIVDHRVYFPGYHMNKRHWITICLDDSVTTEELLHLVDESYQLAAKQGKGFVRR